MRSVLCVLSVRASVLNCASERVELCERVFRENPGGNPVHHLLIVDISGKKTISLTMCYNPFGNAQFEQEFHLEQNGVLQEQENHCKGRRICLETYRRVEQSPLSLVSEAKTVCCKSVQSFNVLQRGSKCLNLRNLT